MTKQKPDADIRENTGSGRQRAAAKSRTRTAEKSQARATENSQARTAKNSQARADRKKIEAESREFNYLTNEIDSVYHETALRLGLSDSAMIILYTVCQNGRECLLNDIMRLSGISKQTVNSALRKLEREDILYLEALSGRKKKICLTEKGLALAKSTVFRLIQLENDIFAGWTERERQFYIELTRRYLAAIKEKMKEL